jgi:molecular chaperone GrpE
MTLNSKSNSSKVTKLQAKLDQLQDQLNRSLADYVNLEKRIESQKQIWVSLATASLIEPLIAVLDDFYLAYSHLSDPGLKMAIDKFASVLKSQGVEEIQARDREFDPSLMDCVEVAPGKDNLVLAVRKKGYQFNGQTLRPAQVVVGKSDPSPNSDSNNSLSS